MRIAFLAVVGFAMSCTCKQPEVKAPADALVQDMKRALAERDRRLGSYHVAVTTVEGTNEAQHEFFFRSPNHSRGVVLKPAPLTLSFDGRTLYKLSPDEKKLEVYELKLPVEKASYFLLTQFSPFVPEGYRTPLLPTKGVTAKKTTHPLAADAVELSVQTPDGSGGIVSTSWILRSSSGDFLAKMVTSSAGSKVTMVETEQCDAIAKLCVPTSVTERENGSVVASMKMTTVEINSALANDAFALTAPEGFTTENHTLEETAPASP